MKLLLLWSNLIRLLLHYSQNAISQKVSTSNITSLPSSHINDQAETCCGHCALQFINDLIGRIGKNETSNLINFNYNNFLFAMSNATILQHFCKEFHQFEHCCSMCIPSYSQEILMGYSEIINQICIYNFKDIKENFGCLAGLNSQIRQLCMRICTPYQEAFHSIARNFRHFILNSDITILENYLNESCEYVLCSLHCDVPLIAHDCGYHIVEKIIALTRKSFKSMKKLSLDTAVVNRWPQACTEIITYRIPKQNLTTMQQTNLTITIQPQQIKQIEKSGQQSQKMIKLLSSFLSLFIYFTLE
uniref:CPG4 domain-containing protein n=2 Tax=Wuchereria bancrofti TaxID=6293 RepID=A0AAF5PUK3_WUCBA